MCSNSAARTPNSGSPPTRARALFLFAVIVLPEPVLEVMSASDVVAPVGTLDDVGEGHAGRVATRPVETQRHSRRCGRRGFETVAERPPQRPSSHPREDSAVAVPIGTMGPCPSCHLTDPRSSRVDTPRRRSCRWRASPTPRSAGSCAEQGGLDVCEMITSRGLVERDETTQRTPGLRRRRVGAVGAALRHRPQLRRQGHRDPVCRVRRAAHRPELRPPGAQGHAQGRRRSAAVEAGAARRDPDGGGRRRDAVRRSGDDEDAQGPRRTTHLTYLDRRPGSPTRPASRRSRSCTGARWRRERTRARRTGT